MAIRNPTNSHKSLIDNDVDIFEQIHSRKKEGKKLQVPSSHEFKR